MKILGRGYAWLDTGTHESLLDASRFIQTIQQRQGQLVASPDEIAFRQGYIDAAQFAHLAGVYGKSTYGSYLSQVLEEVDIMAAAQ